MKIPTANDVLAFLFLASAVLGYIVSYGKFYLFHAIAILYISAIAIGLVKIKTKSFKTTSILILFIFFATASLLWAPDVVNGLYTIFYLLCGYLIVFFIVNYAADAKKLKFVFLVLASFISLNIFIGLLETLSVYRLPMSPFYETKLTRPTGFNFNPNDFGFVFISILSFLFFYPSKIIKFIALILSLWFILKLESKGFFAAILFFYFLLLIHEMRRVKFETMFGVLAILILAPTLVIILVKSHVVLDNRAFSLLIEINRGLELMSSPEILVEDSTSHRAYMYSYGLEQLFESNGFGLGALGIGSLLAKGGDTAHAFHSFHNFFLEMLIDFGILPFVIMMTGYFYLSLRLIKISKFIQDDRLSYFANASGFSLLAMLPASISPSSIIYMFIFYLIIGFAIATLNICNKHCYSIFSSNIIGHSRPA